MTFNFFKRVLTLCFIFYMSLANIACVYTNKESKELISNLIAMKDSIPQYPKEEQASYVLHLNTKTPYELYLDDILINDESGSGISQTIQLNPYLLNNGTHTIKIRYLPMEDSKDGLLHPDDVYATIAYKWKVHFIRLKLEPTREFLGYEGTIDYPSSELEVIPPPTDVPFWEQEWTVEIKDLPYDLRGWRDGEDLSEWDQDELEKKVLAYYNYLRDLLNEGKIGEFMKVTNRQDVEVAIATYSTPEEYETFFKENIEDIKNDCVGHMQPIDNYVMKLYAHGKLVVLKIPAGEFKNWGTLISDSEKCTSSYGIYLYKPRGEKDFVPIRK